METDVTLITAFLFGILSFISPCVLPIVPGYLSFISGISFEEMQSAENAATVRKRILINALFFVIGFSVVFIALGASATFIGKFLSNHINVLSKIAGAIIIIFGIHMTGLVKIPFLNYEKRFHSRGKKFGLAGSFLVGLAFAFGWTPCIGPILAAILAIASQQDSISKGILLLSAYSLGLGLPFILTGWSITAFYNAFNKFKKHIPKVEIIGGILLIIIGVLIMTNTLTILSGYFSKLFPFLNDLG